MTDKENIFYSHYRAEDGVYQTNQAHARNVAALAKRYCRIPLLKNMVWLIGLHHDDGKNTETWQAYFRASLAREGGREKEDHSTLGGLVMGRYDSGSRFLEMVQAAIYMHHGISDCISFQDDSVLLERRKSKYSKEAIAQAAETFRELFPEVDMDKCCKDAKRELIRLTNEIIAFSKDKTYGSAWFYIGMCERMLLSCLIDADWRDTSDFMAGRETLAETAEEDIQAVWSEGIRHLEKRLDGFSAEGLVGAYRKKISEQCKAAAFSGHTLFQLTVPTGSGKTLSSLRFALYCAKEYHKRHIFYIAPFKSILEQNADEIRRTLGDPNMVLEHHSDVVQTDDEQFWRYERLIENWDESPVVVTTAVQFLNTLFKENRKCIRRFHSLCDSVIIFDEVQALPIKIVELFNMAVNFLTKVCHSTVVLCTATQPLFSKIRNNKMLPCARMVDRLADDEKAFLRVTYHNCIPDCGSGFSAEQAADFVLEQAVRFRQVLMILNTKSAARKVYDLLEGRTEGALYYLSTQMCAEHRSDVLKEIKKKLLSEEPVICISTQLVEAGVDFSFRCVIRSLAGLDNLIQAAGRCNRDGKLDMGHVYLIKMSPETENVSSLPDIGQARKAMMEFLDEYEKHQNRFGNRMDSEQSIEQFYQKYFYNRQKEMCYPVELGGVRTDLVDMLSHNEKVFSKRKGIHLKQAFKSAGEQFCVIEETGGKDIIVPYGEGVGLIDRLQTEQDAIQKKMIIRSLQRYTVHLSDSLLRKLGRDAVWGLEENKMLLLDERYYSEKTGVKEEASAMPFLTM